MRNNINTILRCYTRTRLILYKESVSDSKYNAIRVRCTPASRRRSLKSGTYTKGTILVCSTKACCSSGFNMVVVIDTLRYLVYICLSCSICRSRWYCKACNSLTRNIYSSITVRNKINICICSTRCKCKCACS